jgi:hypothetical protein
MTLTQTPLRITPRRRRRSGPPLWVPFLVFTKLTVIYVIINSSGPHSYATGAAVLQYAQAHGTQIQAGAFLMFASAVLLAVIAALVHQRLRDLAVTGPGPVIALVGGVLGASALTAGAMAAWAEGHLSADAPPALARALADLSIMASCPAFAAGLALLLAAVSFSGLRSGLLPRPLCWAGLVLAACGVLGALRLLIPGFDFMFPPVRLGGALFLLLAAFRLRPAGGEVPASEPDPVEVPSL